MAQPIKRTFTGAAVETAGAGVGNGILGGLAGFLGGGVVGAVTGIVIAGTVLGAAGLLGGAVVGSIFDIEGAAVTGAAFLGKWGAIAGGTLAGISGATTGTLSGGIVGGIRGLFVKSRNISEDIKLANGVIQSKEMKQMQQMAAVREQAADQYTQVGYAQGIQDGYMKGQQDLVAQLQQAALQQQQTEKQPNFVAKEAARRGTSPEALAQHNHAEHAQASRETAGQSALGA